MAKEELDKNRNKIVVNGSDSMIALIDRYAEGRERSEAAEDLIRIGLLSHKKLQGPEFAQIEAESLLLELVEQFAATHRQKGFSQDITKQFFNSIENTALETYTFAIGGGDPYDRGNSEKTRINRKIGRRMRALLGASVLKGQKGRRAKIYTPAGEKSLITAYTPLLAD